MNQKQGHKLTLALLLCTAGLVAGCDNKPKTFAEYYPQYQQELGNQDPRLHDTTEIDGYVVALGSTAAEQDRRFGVGIYELADDGWNSANGGSCDAPWSRLGHEQLVVYCGQLQRNLADVTQVLANERDARVVHAEGSSAWYAVSQSRSVHLKYMDDAGKLVWEKQIRGD